MSGVYITYRKDNYFYFKSKPEVTKLTLIWEKCGAQNILKK